MVRNGRSETEAVLLKVQIVNVNKYLLLADCENIKQLACLIRYRWVYLNRNELLGV